MDVVDYIKDALHVLNIWRHDIIMFLRQPTPVKIVHVVTTLDDGCIGSGLDDTSNPDTIYEVPMSHEAWLHRISITSPSYLPADPLTTGQILLYGSTGEMVTWTPQPGTENNVLPAQFLEGRISAPHLSAGEKLYVVGDQLPSNIKVRFDLQVNLVAGVSSMTPLPDIGSALASHHTNTNGS